MKKQPLIEVAIRTSYRLGLFFFIFITLIIFSSTVPSALACSPAPGYETPTISERTKAATVILEVTLDEPEGTDERPYYHETASFTVHQWLKGSGPDTITVTGFGPGAACLSSIPAQRAILFATGDPKSGELSLNYVGLHDAVVSPSDREEIIEVVGAEPTIPETTSVTEPIRVWWIGLVALWGAGLGAGLLMIRKLR